MVFKISNQDENKSLLECQDEVFQMLEGHNETMSAPRSIHSVNGNAIEAIESGAGVKHFCRMVTYIDGRLFSSVNPHTPELLVSLGQTIARIDLALCDFEHAAIERPLLWNMVDGVKVLNSYKSLIQDSGNLGLVNYYEKLFVERVLPVSDQLRFGVIHNDANDNNIVVEETGPWNQRVKGIIDFGDMVYSWIVVDAAVTAAYSMLGKSSPLEAAGLIIKGFNQQYPLTETEISVLFELICMRLCMSVCICAHQQSEQPENHYLRISEKPAWQVLKILRQVSPDFAHYIFRDLCNYEPVPKSARIVQWLQSNPTRFESIVEIDLSSDPLHVLDTGVASPDLPNPAVPFDPHLASRQIFRQVEDNGCVAAIGKYDEYRLIYSSDDFVDQTGHRRTLHLGIDIFIAAGSVVKAPLAGKVFGVANNNAPLDYGGTLILEHEFQDAASDGAKTIKFYTLYGHLSPDSLRRHEPGVPIAAGQVIAAIGDIHENGYWVPHVHFEIITDMLGCTDTFVGVGSHEHRNVWLSLCPDPNVILGIPESASWTNQEDPDSLCESIMHGRARSLGPSLSLSYRQPIHMARGGMQYLYDTTGRKYLDAVNNVPHVGHCHPVVVAASSRQSRVLNTNTRYLYSVIDEYSERLLDKFPDPLNVCFLVNSGSEANDLALRLAGNYTDRKDFVIIDHAYHGNLSSLIDISPYKHNGAGGKGPPDNVHTVIMPDPYRDGYSDHLSVTEKYSGSVNEALHQAESRSGVAAFIAESILGCGGQVVLPEGYLQEVYARIRSSGGVCIADEVQVGFGRVGSHYWAFETQNIVPDIVTLGKPMGNGHPLAAVITTREIADAFNNGMEYFNTFGGNPVSCAIGNAVLDVIENEKLQQNALEVGTGFLDKLEQLKLAYPVIGDVRGLGLFIGIELVNDRHNKVPAAAQASYISERMKQKGILISTDGPMHNVLKIKPPICFSHENADQCIEALAQILQEDFAQPGISEFQS
jgi:4-aminobutyrate aminotransferase-like enzyme/Ser/Thr protein kinase RdoA (MazF antagonist)